MHRTSGILLHPTSLPGPYGIGDLGEAAAAFVDQLAAAGQTWWQVLPLNPTDDGGSPYASFSAFAGNALLIALEPLVERGWLEPGELTALKDFAASEADDRANLRAIAPLKFSALRRAFERHDAHAEVAAFAHTHASWLADVALFSALKDHHGGKGWRDWPEALVTRQPEALEAARRELAEGVRFAEFLQWLFDAQWQALKRRANAQGVKIIGDLPIFVAMDSADVWANRGWFEVEADGSARDVAGVPPDYFSATGQKWGNPLYAWDALASDGYGWWIRRVIRVLEQCDLVRIDHFRGFESYWAVPESAPTAETGEWRKGPGDAFFDAVRAALGDVPFIAEDLGIITEDVTALRERQGLPGMKILQFAFDGNPNHPFLPHTYPKNCAAYTGTHDNDTSQGWYDSLSEPERHRVRSYLHHGDDGIVWAMMRAVCASEADLIVFPFQDIFELDAQARMNIPGTSEGNWGWRASAAQLADGSAFERLATMTRECRR